MSAEIRYKSLHEIGRLGIKISFKFTVWQSEIRVTIGEIHKCIGDLTGETGFNQLRITRYRRKIKTDTTVRACERCLVLMDPCSFESTVKTTGK